jgi:hypothetical protein
MISHGDSVVLVATLVGNGSDERDDGFVEQHCNECSVKW